MFQLMQVALPIILTVALSIANCGGKKKPDAPAPKSARNPVPKSVKSAENAPGGADKRPVKYYNSYCTHTFLRYCHENFPDTMRFCFDVPYSDHKHLIESSGIRYLQKQMDYQTKIYFPNNEMKSDDSLRSNQIWIVGSPINVQRVYRNLRDCSQYVISFKKSHLKDKSTVNQMIEHIVDKKLKVMVSEKVDNTYHISSDRRHYEDLMECCKKFLSNENTDLEYILSVSIQCVISDQTKDTSEGVKKWISDRTQTKIFSPTSSFYMGYPSSFFIKGKDINNILQAETYLVGSGTIVMSFDVDRNKIIDKAALDKWRNNNLLDIWIDNYEGKDYTKKKAVFIRTVEFNINEAYKAAFYLMEKKLTLVENIYIPICRSLNEFIKQDVFTVRNMDFLTLSHGKIKSYIENIDKNVDEEYHKTLANVQVSPFSTSNSSFSNEGTPKNKSSKKKRSPKKNVINVNNDTNVNCIKMKKNSCDNDVKNHDKLKICQNSSNGLKNNKEYQKDKNKNSDNVISQKVNPSGFNNEQSGNVIAQPNSYYGCLKKSFNQPTTVEEMKNIIAEEINLMNDYVKLRSVNNVYPLQDSGIMRSINETHNEDESENTDDSNSPSKMDCLLNNVYIYDKYPRSLSSTNLQRVKTWVMMSIEELNESILSYIRPFILSNEIYCFIGYCIPDDIYRLEYRLIPNPKRLISRIHRTKYPRYNYFPSKCFSVNEVVFHDFESNEEVESLLNSPRSTEKSKQLILSCNTYPWIAPMSISNKSNLYCIRNQITKKFWYFKHSNLIPITAGDGMNMYMHVNLSRSWNCNDNDFYSKHIFNEYIEQTRPFAQMI
uniref:RdRp catalytic domain-containing protein n=1 Tax=Parastrongyloides trichosuri TaxID=131310 RepID=A0A0N4ZX05_PARTI